jgi:three-Cys-motif partner protein
MKFITLPSADGSPWKDPISATDGLPARKSGEWIAEKHHHLTYFAKMFSTSMKSKWKHLVYLETFSGPGRCFVSDTGKERPGSPLQIINQDFTRFIFIDINTAACRALEQRLTGHPNADKVEIWNGDCREVVNQLVFEENTLTFGFIDPTGIAHAPFSLIKTLQGKTRGDLLINVQHGMGIKMNMHQYHPDSDENCALTLFLGDESWKPLLGPGPKEFFSRYFDLYRQKLASIGYVHTKNHVVVNMSKSVPLYILLFASAHKLGQGFWDKAVKGVDSQASFLDQL